jgi:hypothetical protein
MNFIDLIVVYVFLTIPLSLAAMFYAGRLHRNRGGWFFLSLVFSPIVTFAMLFGLGPVQDDDDEYEEVDPERPHGRLTSKLLCLAGLLMLAGCAHGLVGTLPVVQDDAAEVIIARELRFIGGGAILTVTVDGTELYAIAAGEHAAIKIPPGDRVLGVVYYSMFFTREEITQALRAEPRQAYYFRIDPGFAPILNRLTTEAGRDLVSTTRSLVSK